jgi:exonuclease VII small subunit
LTREKAINLSRHVTKLIKERELQLKMLMIDDEDEKRSYINAVDE